jgi:CTP synthase
MYGDGKNPADVVFVEVGGTVGDYENGFYIEALRELAFEEGPGSMCFVALTYVIEPPALGEQKSKAAQLGIKRLMEAGIQPHIIACRATNPCTHTVMQKIAMFSNVPLRRVFSMHDRPSIYTSRTRCGRRASTGRSCRILNARPRGHRGRRTARARSGPRSREADHGAQAESEGDIGLTGKYAALRDAYASIDKALEHCAAHLGVRGRGLVDRDRRDDGVNVAEAAGGLDGGDRAGRVRGARGGGQDRVREVLPRERDSRTWESVLDSRWR